MGIRKNIKCLFKKIFPEIFDNLDYYKHQIKYLFAIIKVILKTIPSTFKAAIEYHKQLLLWSELGQIIRDKELKKLNKIFDEKKSN
jgi:hypothetical protein